MTEQENGLLFRGLLPEEIEVRVGNITAKGANLLLYKTVRSDMNILDEVFGTLYWQRDHKEVKGNMYAGVGVYNKELSEWAWKWDCGTENFAEKEKSEASDSFKRACTNLGIGRELYTAPRIFVLCDTEKDGKRHVLKNSRQFYGIHVSEIKYSEFAGSRKILGVKICDQYEKTIWELFSPMPLNEIQIKWIKDSAKNLGVEPEKVFETFKVESFEEMDSAMMMSFKKKLDATEKKMNAEAVG